MQVWTLKPGVHAENKKEYMLTCHTRLQWGVRWDNKGPKQSVILLISLMNFLWLACPLSEINQAQEFYLTHPTTVAHSITTVLFALFF